MIIIQQDYELKNINKQYLNLDYFENKNQILNDVTDIGFLKLSRGSFDVLEDALNRKEITIDTIVPEYFRNFSSETKNIFNQYKETLGTKSNNICGFITGSTFDELISAYTDMIQHTNVIAFIIDCLVEDGDFIQGDNIYVENIKYLISELKTRNLFDASKKHIVFEPKDKLSLDGFSSIPEIDTILSSLVLLAVTSNTETVDEEDNTVYNADYISIDHNEYSFTMPSEMSETDKTRWVEYEKIL